jgi:hypothetical protein
MNETPRPQPITLTDQQAALIEIAQLRIASNRLRMTEQRENGKLKGTVA